MGTLPQQFEIVTMPALPPVYCRAAEGFEACMRALLCMPVCLPKWDLPLSVGCAKCRSLQLCNLKLTTCQVLFLLYPVPPTE